MAGILMVLMMSGGMGAPGCPDDCSLNGQCDSGFCSCDLPWSGVSCGVLRTAAAAPGGLYGFAVNVSSWGGSLVTDFRARPGQPDRHHLFAAQMRTGGLVGWGSESECVHATAATPSGPFVYKDTAVGAWCHGPQVVRDPSTGEWLMVHVGPGPQLTGASSSFMHHAASPDGPWTPATTSPGRCDMPSAAFHPNGTLFVICGNGHAITHVTSPLSTPAWEANWSAQVPLKPAGEQGSWEDPDIWFDKDENFHILYHVYSIAPYSAHQERCSGHAWSRDGVDWSYSGVQPFNCTVSFTDGTRREFATRERPHLVFTDPSRTAPVAVVTAVSSQPVGPSCDSCKSGACSQCKVTPGRDWTFTQLEPFVNFPSQ